MEQPSRLKIILVAIWPTIYRIINTTLYFILTLIKGMTRIAVEQIRNI